MRKGRVLVLTVALVALISGSAFALVLGGDTWFKVAPSGPMSIKNGNSLTVKLLIVNNTDSPRSFSYIQSVVIDPFTGARIFGPKLTAFAQPLALPPHGTQTYSVVLGPINAQDKTLAAVITILDAGSVVRGVAGWGFVTN